MVQDTIDILGKAKIPMRIDSQIAGHKIAHACIL